MYDINIIIVNWKMKDDIDKCLASLYPDATAGNLAIIVHIIDNSRNVDGVKEMLQEKYPQAVYHDPGGNIGFGKGQNLGISFASARYYLPLNPDIEFLPGTNTLKRMVDFLDERPDIGIAGPLQLNLDGSIQDSCCRFPAIFDQIAKRLKLDQKIDYFKKRTDYYLMRDFDHKSTVAVDWLIGSFMLVRKDLIDKIGTFDDRYQMYFEDCDWCRRAWHSGFEVWYIHDIMVKHAHRRDSDGGSVLKLILKNPVTRIHIESWIKYTLKWGIKNEHFGY